MAPIFRLRSANDVKEEAVSKLRKICRMTSQTLPSGLLTETKQTDKCALFGEEQLIKQASSNASSNASITKKTQSKITRKKPLQRRRKTTKHNKVDKTILDDSDIEQTECPDNMEVEDSLFDEGDVSGFTTVFHGKRKADSPVAQEFLKKLDNKQSPASTNPISPPAKRSTNEGPSQTPSSSKSQNAGVTSPTCEELTAPKDDSPLCHHNSGPSGIKRRGSPVTQSDPKKLNSKSSPETTKAPPPTLTNPTTANPISTQTPKTPHRHTASVRSPPPIHMPPRQLNTTPVAQKENDPRSADKTGGEAAKARTAEQPRRPKHAAQPSLQIAVTSTDDGSITAVGFSKGKNPEFRKVLCKALGLEGKQLTRITEIREQKKVLATVVGDFNTLENKLEDNPIDILAYPQMTLHVALKQYAYLIKGVDTSADLNILKSSVADISNIDMNKVRFLGKTENKDRAAVYFETETQLKVASLTYLTCVQRGNWKERRVIADIHAFDKTKIGNHASNKPSLKKPDHSSKVSSIPTTPKTSVPNKQTHQQQTNTNRNKQIPRSHTHPLLPTPKHHQHIAMPPLPKDPFVLFLLERIDRTHWDNVHLQQQVNHLRHTLRQAENLTPWSRPYPHMNRH